MAVSVMQYAVRSPCYVMCCSIEEKGAVDFALMKLDAGGKRSSAF